MICLSPDGSKVALTSESERGLDIWDFKTGTRLYSLPDEAGTGYWLAWSPDSRRVAIARDNGKIAIWDLDTVSQILAKLGLNP
jgi:WD40 repeat protein